MREEETFVAYKFADTNPMTTSRTVFGREHEKKVWWRREGKTCERVKYELEEDGCLCTTKSVGNQTTIHKQLLARIHTRSLFVLTVSEKDPFAMIPTTL